MLIHLQHYVGLNDFFEAFLRGRERVGADGKQGKRVRRAFVGGDGAFEPGFDVLRCDSGAYDGAAAAIVHFAGDGGGVLLGVQKGSRQQ